MIFLSTTLKVQCIKTIHQSALEIRFPIFIDGDANFIPENGVTEGSGTIEDPYVIEGWEIFTSPAHGIHIQHTRAYFIIRDVIIHEVKPTEYTGILLDDVHNSRIENSEIVGNEYGIHLSESNHNNIINNNVSFNNYNGIELIGSEYNKILNNTISFHLVRGISLSDSNHNVVSYNLLTSNAEAPMSDNILVGGGHNIISNNNISDTNGDGIFLSLSRARFNNVSSNYIEAGDTGIYLWGTSDNKVFNNNLSQCGGGIHVGASSSSGSYDNEVFNNFVTETNWGIAINDYKGTRTRIFNNTVTSNNKQGVSIWQSSSTTVTNNNVTNNGDYGVHIDDARSVSISENTIIDNSRGIYIIESYDTTAFKNYINSNGRGLFIEDSSTISASENLIINNNIGIEVEASSTINLLNNTLSENGKGIFIDHSTGCFLRENSIENSEYNFGIDGSQMSEYEHDIDFSNMINGKSIYYLAGLDNLIIDSTWQMGYLAVISSSNVLIEGITMTNNIDGVLLANVINSVVKDNTVNNNYYGVKLFSCYGNIIYNNILENIYNVYDNGVNSWNTSKTLGTNIIGGPYIGGNYYDDYTGEDIDSDGLGDTPYLIYGGSNVDHLPLSKEISEVELNVTISADKNLLRYHKNEVEITVKIKNIGDYVARDVSIDILVPYNFETQDNTHWSGDVQVNEEKIIFIDAKAKRCISGDFIVQGTYKDAQNETITIPSKYITILVEDWILLVDEVGWTDVNLSPQTVIKSKSLGGAENTAASLWLITTALDLGFDELTIETLLEHASDLVDWLEEIISEGGVSPELLVAMIDILTGLGLNTLGIWIDANEWGRTKIYDDGTLDYHAVWMFEALKSILGQVIDGFLQAVVGGIEHKSNNLLGLTDPQGRLFLSIFSPSGQEIPVHYGNHTALAILPLDVESFSYSINATEAHETTEEYNLIYISIREGNITEGNLISDAIDRGEIQEFNVQLDPEGKVESMTRTFLPEWEAETYPVTIESNSTVSSFDFSQSLGQISFNVTGPDDTTAFCNITIPETLMWVDDLSEWNVTINGIHLSQQERTVTFNGTNYSIYFTCNTSTVKIQVTSKHVIPEFPTSLILMLFMIVTLFVVVLRKRYTKHKP